MGRKHPGKPPSQRGEPDDFYPPGKFRDSITDPSVYKAIQDAHVVFGVDEKTGDKHLFFGKVTLERIIKTGDGKAAMIVNLPVDFGTDDPEVLCASLMSIKGSHCYQTPDGGADQIHPGLN